MSRDHVVTLIWLGGPLVGAVTLTAAAGFRWGHWPRMLLLGLVLAATFILVAYLRAPPDYQHSNGTEGEMFLGRWWDPDWVVTLTSISYLMWTLGVFLGFALRLVAQDPADETDGTNGSI